MQSTEFINKPVKIADIDISGKYTCANYEQQYPKLSTHIEALNRLIAIYNNCNDKLNKIQALNNVYLKQQEMERLYAVFSMPKDLPQYTYQTYNKLLPSIKTAYLNLGATSMHPNDIKKLMDVTQNLDNNNNPVEQTDILEKILIDMSQMQANMMLKILLQFKEDKNQNNFANNICTLFQKAYPSITQFLKNNQIEYLGGGNSQNFKITNTIINKSSVLKINADWNPQQPVYDLQNNMLKDNNYLATTYATHKAIAKNRVMSTLSITDYYNGGDLMNFRKHTKNTTELFNIYSQVIVILKHAQANGYASPDVKNANFLIDTKTKKVTITDTKAFIPIDKDTMKPNINNYNYILSQKYYPPNTDKNAPLDKINVYQLGLCVYQYYTGQKYTANAFYAKIALFTKNDQENNLNLLIEHALEPDAYYRISLDQFNLILKKIEKKDIQPEALFNLLTQIKYTKNALTQLGRLGSENNEFIKKQLKTLDMTIDYNDIINTIHTETEKQINLGNKKSQAYKLINQLNTQLDQIQVLLLFDVISNKLMPSDNFIQFKQDIEKQIQAAGTDSVILKKIQQDLHNTLINLQPITSIKESIKNLNTWWKYGGRAKAKEINQHLMKLTCMHTTDSNKIFEDLDLVKAMKKDRLGCTDTQNAKTFVKFKQEHQKLTQQSEQTNNKIKN